MAVQLSSVTRSDGPALIAGVDQPYEYGETREVEALVKAAVDLVRTRGEAAFDEFRAAGSRWRKDDTYVFVLDRHGNMLVHHDPAIEGKNQLDLKDIIGKPIVRGLIEAVTTFPERRTGWYHYQWFVPGGILPRWKSSYVELVTAPSGTSYVVGSGVYNDRMERSFVVDAVSQAVSRVQKDGAAAFSLFRDPTGPFIVKDAYIFVIDMNGVDLVNPAFPNLEGRNLLDVKDTAGKYLIREMLTALEVRDVAWVDYMWPKPGESVSTQKSAYVSRARLGDTPVLVGCGVYLADAPKGVRARVEMAAPELMALVRDGAAILEREGEHAYPQFRKKGSRWFSDATYFFIHTMDGIRAFHATEASGEGEDASDLKDILGRPIGRMILDVAGSPTGEGWIHYMYPEPGNIFPVWKSTFVKRVTYPSGRTCVLGAGIYNMRTDKAIIEDIVDRAAILVADRGAKAFDQLRDKKGSFVYMDTYVFVHDTDGIELVNAALPSLEGRNLIELRDLNGKAVVREQIAATTKAESAWLECYWFKPGDNRPARKQTYVRRVHSGEHTYVVGSGVYLDEA